MTPREQAKEDLLNPLIQLLGVGGGGTGTGTGKEDVLNPLIQLLDPHLDYRSVASRIVDAILDAAKAEILADLAALDAKVEHVHETLAQTIDSLGQRKRRDCQG